MALRKRKTSGSGTEGVDTPSASYSQPKDSCCGCCCFLKFIFWLAFVSATAGGFFWVYQEQLKADEKINSLIQQRLADFSGKLKTQVQRELKNGITQATENFVSFDALDRASSELKQQVDGATRQTLQSSQESVQRSVSDVSERLQKVESVIAGPMEEVQVRVNSIVDSAQQHETKISELQQQLQQLSEGSEGLNGRVEQLRQVQEAADQQAKQTAEALQQRLQQGGGSVEAGTPDLQKFKEEMFTDLENYFNLKYLKTEAASQLKQELGNEVLQVVDQTYSKSADSAAAVQQAEQRLSAQLQQEVAALRADINKN